MFEKDDIGTRSPRRPMICLPRSVSRRLSFTALCLVLVAGLSAGARLSAVPTDVVVNEILYHPDPDNTGGEFVELFNRGETAVDLSGWMFAEAVTFVFPEGTTIESGEYLVVARDPETANAFYGIDALGPYDGRLNNAGETFVLRDAGEQEIDSVPYQDAEPWAVEADGGGPSLELSDPSADNSLAESWAIGDPYTPGAQNAPVDPGGGDIVITEIMYKPRRTEPREKFDNINKGPYTEEGDDLFGEYVEIYNRSEAEVDLSGWVFSEGIEFPFPEGTTLAPDAYLLVAGHLLLKQRLGIDNIVGPFELSLRDGGERITLRDSDDRLVDTVRYDDAPPWPTAPDELGVSLECIAPLEGNGTARNWRSGRNRFPPIEPEAPEFVEPPEDGWERYEIELIARTTRFAVFLEEPGEWLLDSLELRPLAGGDDVIENGSFDENDEGWTKRGNHGDSFRDTEDAKEGAASEHIVATGNGAVSHSLSVILRGIPVPTPHRATFWAKRLSGSRTLTISLLGVGTHTVTPADSRRRLNEEWSISDNPNGTWTYRDGAGNLLRERNANWFAADLGPEQAAWVHGDTETPGWCRSVGTAPARDFPAGWVGTHGPAQVIWSSPAEGRVRISGGAYLVRHNGGDQVWELKLGSETFSTGELIAGATEVNSDAPSLFETGTGGAEVLEMDVRRREKIVLDVRAKPGHAPDLVGIELSIAFAELIDPEPPLNGAVGLGSPGRENAVAQDATPPLVEDLQHFPAQPTSKDPVTITALVTSVNAEISKVELGLERLAGTIRTDLEPMPMFDDGEHNDGEAGDGIYGAIVEPQRSQIFIHYWIVSEDGDGRSMQYPYPTDPAPAQGYFHFDNEIRTEVTTYHLYMERANLSRLTRDPKSDEYLDCSLVINDRRPGKEEGPVAYAHIGGRRRGRSSRFNDRHQWKFKFNRTQLYDDNRVIDTMLRLPLLQRIGFLTFDFAGVTGLESDLVRLYLNGQHWETYLAFESPNPTWASKHAYGGGAEAYKARTVEVAPKNSDLYPNQIVTDFDYWGVWNKKLDPLEPPNGIRELTGALNNLPDEDLLPWFNENVDVEQIMLRYGINILLNIDDFPTHNYYMFRPEAGKWKMLGYDYDSLGRGGVLAFHYADGSEGGGSQRNKFFDRFSANPTLTRMHALTLERLIATLTPESLGPVYDEEMARGRREKGVRGDADRHALTQLRSQTARMRRDIEANRAPGSEEVPMIDPPGGQFAAPVSVTLSVLEGWAAVYTLDGGDPRLSDTATVYTEPIAVNQSMTVRAAAIRARNGGEPSLGSGDWTDLAQAEYVFGEDVGPVFLRGDFSVDGNVNTTDIVQLLLHLFKGQEARCRVAGDTNDDESLNIADAIYLVDFLFRRGPPPAAPFPLPGTDPGGIEPLGCEQRLGL